MALRNRRVPANVARDARLPRKVARAHRKLSHQQVRDLATASGKHETLVLLFADTGLRWGEVTALRVSDFNLARRRIVVSENAVEVGRDTIVGTPKSHKRRSVAFPAFLGAALAAQATPKATAGRNGIMSTLITDSRTITHFTAVQNWASPRILHHPWVSYGPSSRHQPSSYRFASRITHRRPRRAVLHESHRNSHPDGACRGGDRPPAATKNCAAAQPTSTKSRTNRKQFPSLQVTRVFNASLAR
jgi:integrase